MSRWAKWASMAGALLLLAGGLYYQRIVREIPVRVAVPQENVEVRVFGIGTVEAQVVSKVGFQVAGSLLAIKADQGDFVTAGTLLAQLDDASQRKKVEKSEATKRQMAANLTKVQALRDRAEAVYQQKKSVNARRQQLAGRGSVSKEAAEDAQAAEAIAFSDLKVAEAEVAIAVVLQADASAQNRLDGVVLKQHELRAPFAARVIARHKELGSIAGAGETVFTLIAPQSIWIRAHVDESLAGGLKLGQTAFVRLRSEMNQLVETEVVRIDQENDRLTEERRVYVRCRSCSAQHQIRFLGEQAEVEIVTAVIPRGLFIPLKSVAGYDGKSGIVWMLHNGRLERRRVTFGARLLDGRVHVTSKLPDASAIVVDGTGLREGRAGRAVVPGAS